MTYGTLISTQTVGAGGAASIDFSSIPQTYTDLLLVFTLRDDRSGGAWNSPIGLQINGVTTNRSMRDLSQQQGTVASGTATNEWVASGDSPSATANTFGNGQIYIPNYASSTVNKVFSSDYATENNSVQVVTGIQSSLWSSTAAITRLTLTAPYAATGFVQYSTA
jgi:hypothetical protein